MNLSDFDYHLPQELVAQYPLNGRSQSRLFCYFRNGKVEHRQFNTLTEYLSAGDLLVFNNTRVIPARLLGSKPTGGKVEVLVERIIDAQHFLAHIRTSKPLKAGSQFFVSHSAHAIEVISRQDDLFLCQWAASSDSHIMELLEQFGRIPLPPYIERSVEQADAERYQTIYAQTPGAVAAPTAGLHFDEELLKRLSEKGINQGFLTLHVGAGTFQPVRAENINEHKMHSEYLEVNQTLCDQIAITKKQGGKVVAVGTTVVRALETAALSGKLAPYAGETDIFISPGFSFKVIDSLITNFHWPKSSLLMLVSALIGREKLLSLYQQAIEARYRFFSYGDAMLIL